MSKASIAPDTLLLERALPWCAVAGLAAAWLLPLHITWQSSPDLGHAWVVPLLMAYLWWERWDERPAITARPVRAGLWGLAVALALSHALWRLFLTPFPVWPAALALFTATLVTAVLVGAALVGGRSAVRWVGGPLVLLLVTMPIPSAVEVSLIGPLRSGMAALAAEISNAAGQPAMASGTSVRLAYNWVGVDEACGGIRSLQACLMIALFFGEWYRLSLPRRTVLALAGIAAALLGNGGRVIFLALRADAGPGALEASHDLAGWLAMGTSIVLTGWLAWHWAGYRLPQQARREPRQAGASSPAWRWATALAAAFLVSETAIHLWYSRFETAAGQAAPPWAARLPEGRSGFRAEPLTVYARELLRPDHFAAGGWPIGDDRSAAAYYIEWHRGQVARAVPFLHNPTVCLPLAGCELERSLPSLAVRWHGMEIPFFAYRFRRLGEPILVAFTIWDPQRQRLLTAPVDDAFALLSPWRWAQIRDSGRHQPAQMLTVSIPWSDDAPARMQSLLTELIQQAPVVR